MTQFIKNKIIGFAIGRTGNIVAAIIHACAGFISLDVFLSDGAQEVMWQHVAGALTILITGGLQYLGSAWAQPNIKHMQEETGNEPDGIPGDVSGGKIKPKSGNPNRR